MGLPERMLMSELCSDNKKQYCCYCGKHIILKNDKTKEHLLPKTRGGRNCPDNIRPCCKSCNVERGHKTYRQWMPEVRCDLRMAIKRLPNSEYHVHRLTTMLKNIQYWDKYCEEKNHLINRYYILPKHIEKT